MNISTFDLNLLRVLDALLQHTSVSQAAAVLHLSQPATSNALNRLRRQLQDPILVRVGNRMVATPRAAALHGTVRQALALVEDALRSDDAFDPATTAGTVRLMATDYVATLLLPRLWERLHREAPGLALAVVYPTEGGSSRMLEEGLVDLALAGPSAVLQGNLKQQLLFDEHFVCIARRNHPALRDGLTLDAYCALEHVLASPRGGGFSSALDEHLQALGRSRRVRLSVAQFLVGPRLVAESDLLMTLGRRLAEDVARQFDLAIHDLPFTPAGFQIVQAWHLRLDRDPLQRWMRAQARACAETL